MTDLGGQLLHALGVAFAVLWEILWAPILSFGLSAAVQAWFPRERCASFSPTIRCDRSIHRSAAVAPAQSYRIPMAVRG